jgi:hypothetical protein
MAESFADTVLCANGTAQCRCRLDHRRLLCGRERGGQCSRGQTLSFQWGRGNTLTIQAIRPEWLIAEERHDHRWYPCTHSSRSRAGAAVMDGSRHVRKEPVVRRMAQNEYLSVL